MTQNMLQFLTELVAYDQVAFLSASLNCDYDPDTNLHPIWVMSV